jgi:hypothetical protein
MQALIERSIKAGYVTADEMNPITTKIAIDSENFD